RLRNFTHDARLPKTTEVSRKECQYKERLDWTDRRLPEDSNIEHQKLHVHYVAQKHADMPLKMLKMETKRQFRCRENGVPSKHDVFGCSKNANMRNLWGFSSLLTIQFRFLDVKLRHLRETR
ncbi:hypothetical protein PMAYCL1PPCAC_31614, partial [Pristionchus mayeri]